jgi:hypothetical protein
MAKPIIKVWKRGGFTLKLYDTNRPNGRGRTYLAYKFYDRGELIFRGEDFSPSPMYCDDSPETVTALLTFLSLRPGDTDREYFEGYSPRQLAWCRERGEELGMYAMELEERARR